MSTLPDVLYLTHRVPYPPDKGDRIRCFHLIEYLRRRARIHLACLADEPVPDETLAALRQRCHRLEILPLGGPLRWGRALGSLLGGGSISEGVFAHPALRRTVEQWSGEVRFQGALASASSLAPCLFTPRLDGARKVIDLMDVDSEKWLDYAAARRGPKSWLYRLEGARVRRLEQRLARWADGLALVSDNEVALFRRFCPDAPAHGIPNGVDLDYFTPQETREEEQTCVFVGALDYLPNVDAAVWFCREVWPRVRKACPGAKFWVVGRRPAPQVLELGGRDGVEVVGQVPDVRPYVARAAVTVVPLLIARGIQNKALESLAMGKATVVSPQTMGGLKAKAGVDLAVAATPEEWAATVLGLLRDGEKRRRLGQAGRRHVEECHRWESCLAPFADLLGLGESAVTPRVGTSTGS